MSEQRVYRGRAGLGVMLATDKRHSDLYDSWFDLPVDHHSFSTERKVVEQGQGAQLKAFLEAPVHTGRDRAAAPRHRLPRWIEDAIEAYIVRAGRQNWGYTLELVGSGHPSVGWVLQRLLGRRALLYHKPGPHWGTSAQGLHDIFGQGRSEDAYAAGRNTRDPTLAAQYAGAALFKRHLHGIAHQNRDGGVGCALARKGHVQPGRAIVTNFGRNGLAFTKTDLRGLRRGQPRMASLFLFTRSGRGRSHLVFLAGGARPKSSDQFV